jgi:hypothetical protein
LIGFLLSPLSWWNDLFINIPLAYLFAIPFWYISKSLFMPMMIIFYWLTNVLGLILMHKGITNIKSEKNSYTKKEFAKDILFSLAYSLLIIILVYFGILKFPTDYFN